MNDDEKHQEAPPKYAEAMYSVENTASGGDGDNIHIRPPFVASSAATPDVTGSPPVQPPPPFMPPPPMQYQQHQGPTIMLSPQQPVFVKPLMFGSRSQAMICPNCGANIVSQTKHETGLANWLVSGAVCLVGGWCGCCLIPFCIEGLKDVEHYCPNCQAMMGRYRRV